MTHRSDRRPDTPMISAAATRCRLTYGNRARGFHQGQSATSLANRPVIVTQSFLCPSALQLRGSPYSTIIFPKNHLIWRVSVRLPEILGKIMTVCRAVSDQVLVRLRAEG